MNYSDKKLREKKKENEEGRKLNFCLIFIWFKLQEESTA